MTPQDVVEHLEVVQAVPTRPHCSGSPTAPSSRSVLKPSGPKSSAGRRASGPSTLRAAADSGHPAESDRSRVLSGWWGLIVPVGTQLHVIGTVSNRKTGSHDARYCPFLHCCT